MNKIVNVLNGNYEPISYSKNYVEQIILKKDKEIERLNNIINRMEEALKEMYITFGEFNEEYTEKKIRELKEGK